MDYTEKEALCSPQWYLLTAILTLNVAAGMSLIAQASNTELLFILAAIVRLCYGGGFGTLPTTARDFFRVEHAGAVYGLMLVGCSLGGVIGPDKSYTPGCRTIGIVALVAIVLPVVTKMPHPKADGLRTTTAGATGDDAGKLVD